MLGKPTWLLILLAIAILIDVTVLALVPGSTLNNYLTSGQWEAGIKITPMCAGKPVRSCGKAAGKIANVRSSHEWREDNSNWVGELKGDEMIPILGTEEGQPVEGANKDWYVVCWPAEEGEIVAYVYSSKLEEEGDISLCMPKRLSH